MPKVYIESEQLRNKVLEMIESLRQQGFTAAKKITPDPDKNLDAFKEFEMTYHQRNALMAVLSLIDEFERR